MIWAAQRFSLPGERAFAVALALTFAGICAAQWLLISPAPRLAGLRPDQWAEIATVAGAAVHLYRTRHRHGPDVIVPGLTSGPGTPAGRTHGAPSAP